LYKLLFVVVDPVERWAELQAAGEIPADEVLSLPFCYLP
jgi:hypothetical protein